MANPSGCFAWRLPHLCDRFRSAIQLRALSRPHHRRVWMVPRELCAGHGLAESLLGPVSSVGRNACRPLWPSVGNRNRGVGLCGWDLRRDVDRHDIDAPFNRWCAGGDRRCVHCVFVGYSSYVAGRGNGATLFCYRLMYGGRLRGAGSVLADYTGNDQRLWLADCTDCDCHLGLPYRAACVYLAQ